jgi:hypothetical protein
VDCALVLNTGKKKINWSAARVINWIAARVIYWIAAWVINWVTTRVIYWITVMMWVSLWAYKGLIRQNI